MKCVICGRETEKIWHVCWDLEQEYPMCWFCCGFVSDIQGCSGRSCMDCSIGPWRFGRLVSNPESMVSHAQRRWAGLTEDEIAQYQPWRKRK